MMRLCGKVSNLGLAVGASLWLFYAVVELQHFYDSAVRVPPTQRVAREVPELRLPALYFCPADRGRADGFQWHSYDCTLSYREERRVCPARLKAYRGRTPEEFRGTPDGELGKASDSGAECLEFGTHMIGVRQEYSAAWNEVTLRAAFRPPRVEGLEDALQEVELGYLSVEWELGQQDTTTERFYYPLLRVPFFFHSQGGGEPGVATRVFLAKEVDRGLTAAGKYWYTYGAMQIAVVNASTPHGFLPELPGLPPEKLGVVHIVITLEDFELFTFQVISAFFPLLAVLGRIAGVAALVAFVLTSPRLRAGRGSKANEFGQTCVSPTGGPEYARVAAPEEEDEGSGEEQQALLSTEAKRESRARSEDRVADQALLGTEEGADGL